MSLITPAMNAEAKRKAEASGFKVSDKIRIRASGTLGEIVYGYGYMGEFGVKTTTGKSAGSVIYLNHYEMEIRLCTRALVSGVGGLARPGNISDRLIAERNFSGASTIIVSWSLMIR